MSSSGELGYLLRNSFSSNDFALCSLWSAGFMRAMLLCCKASRARPSTRRVEVVATEMCVCVCVEISQTSLASKYWADFNKIADVTTRCKARAGEP